MKDGHSFQICKVQPANLNLSNNQQALCNKALDYKGLLLYSYDYSIFVFTLFFIFISLYVLFNNFMHMKYSD